MTRWKAAGSAPRDVDEALWQRFRAAQDKFFGAQQAVQPSRTPSSRPTRRPRRRCSSRARRRSCRSRDPGTARAAYRDLLERWSAIGKVPRDAIRPLDNRLRAIETAINEAEEDRWRRSNPEARARAEETAAKLEAQIDALEAKAAKAEARGDAKAAQEAAASAATYREWLAQAQRAVDDFS